MEDSRGTAGNAAGEPQRQAPSVWTDARRAANPTAVRLWAAAILAACLVVLGIARWLDPKGRSRGVHQDLLGTGPCGMLVMTGFPCPTCGMTTSFAYTVRGQWLRALYVQPAGFTLALGTIGLAALGCWTLVTGRWPRTRVWLINPYWVFLGFLVLLLGAWAFTIVTGLADGSLPWRG